MNRDVKVGDKIMVTMIDGEEVNPAEFRTVVKIDSDKALMLLDSPVAGNNVVEYDSWMYNDEWRFADELPSETQYDDEALSPTYSDAVKAGLTFAEYTGAHITEESLDFEPWEEEALRGITAESLNFEEAPKSDAVNHPSHYNYGDIEVIDFIEQVTEQYEDGFDAYIVGNALKYLARSPHKNGLEDVKKAVWYLERLIKRKEDE